MSGEWDVGAGVWRVGREGTCLESGTWGQVSGEWDVRARVWRVGRGGRCLEIGT